MTVAALQSMLTETGALTRVTSSKLTAVSDGVGGTIDVVSILPGELARQANVSLDVYSRARVLAGEGYGGNPIGRAAAAVVIGQCLEVERRRRRKSSITELVTDCTFAGGDGRYGRQRGRYVATTSDPTRWHIAVSQAIEDGTVPDLARGAYHFAAPNVWVKGIQAGRPLRPFEEIMRSWIIGEKLSVRTIPTVDKYHLLVLGPGSNHQSALAEALDVFNRGRAGDHAPDPGDPDALTSNAAALAVLGTVGFLAWATLNWWR